MIVSKQQPKVSIITGYYNREDFVKESIESLLKQTYENLEIIIFDDASKDNTLNKIYETVNGDERVKITSYKENIGFVNGLIHAIESSTGEYIAIHGSGDISLPDRIRKQVEFLSVNEDKVAVSCFYRNIDPINMLEKAIVLKESYSRDDLFKANPFSHGEVMFKKNVYNIAGGYRDIFKFSQDRDLWLRMSKLGDFGAIQDFLYNRIVNFSGVSYDPGKLVVQKKYSILAVKINSLDLASQNEILDKIREKGIDCYIKSNEFDFQKQVFFMFHVLLFKNKLNNFQPFFQNSSNIFYLYYRSIYLIQLIPGVNKLINNFYLLAKKI